MDKGHLREFQRCIYRLSEFDGPEGVNILAVPTVNNPQRR